jgi:hypothetical protein
LESVLEERENWWCGDGEEVEGMDERVCEEAGERVEMAVMELERVALEGGVVVEEVGTLFTLLGLVTRDFATIGHSFFNYLDIARW